MRLADSVHENLGDKEWIKKINKKTEGRAEDCNDFCSLADSICKNLSDKKWSAKVYKQAEKKAEDCSSFITLACGISENLGDKGWSKKVYKQAEENTEDSSDLKNLGEGILENLGDKKWVKKLLEEAVDKIQCANETHDVGTFIENRLADLTWAKEVYEKVFNFKDSDDHITSRLDIGRIFLETYNDKANATKVLEDAVIHVGEGYYIDIYYFLLDDLKNKNRANKWKDEYFDEMKNDYETYGGGEELFEDNNEDEDE